VRFPAHWGSLRFWLGRWCGAGHTWELVRDFERLLPRGWTVLALAAELRRAEAERQAQQPDMNSNQYYAKWLLIRVMQGEAF
jgi:hypothetical protein